MLGKVRPTTHRENGSDPQPEVGLSEGRLALVHRYMLDAEEAEARVRDAVERTKTEAQRRSQASAPAAADLHARRAAERARREADGRARRRSEEREREAEAPYARSTLPQRDVDEVLHEAAFRAAWAGEAAWPEAQSSLAPATKEERRSVKEAARVLAALEKREARERKALAKAAAKRRLAATYRS